MRRTLALWLLLFGVYAATLGLHAFGSSDYGGDEPHYLLAAHSIVHDGNVDVLDEYRERAYSRFYPLELRPQGRVSDGRLNEPHGVGFPLLIAPAYALGGAKAVELFMAALAALAIALAYRLALRVAPDPWALGAALAVGLSPPLMAYGSAVYPELAAAAALAGAALLAVRMTARVVWHEALVCAVLIGALPWLGTKFVAAGIVVGAFAVRAVWRARRRTLAVGMVETALFSLALYVAIDEAIYSGPTPYAAGATGDAATGASFPGGYLDRAYRLVALFVDRDYGLLRWAPVFALAFAGVWLLWRSRRDLLSRAVPELRDTEIVASLCAAALGAQLLVAAFLAPTMFGFWFPPRHLMAALPLAIPLVAWGLRHAPRVGVALAALTVAASAWLYVDVRWGDGSLAANRPDAPFGPLTDALPLFTRAGGWPFWLAGALGVAVALVVLREALAARHSRQTAGATRARYSG